MKKKLIIVIVLVLMVISGSFFLYQLFQNNNQPNLYGPSQEVINGSGVNTFEAFEKRYQENKKINEDYLGYLEFESGMIMQDVVFADNYDEYLKTDWKDGKWSRYGSVYLDPYADLDSQNMTLYGHTAISFPFPWVAFTTLKDLINEENYESNRFVRLYLEDHYRRYELAHIYHIPLDLNSSHLVPYGMEFMYTEFNEEELEYYLNEVKKIEFYDTGLEIGSKDKFITLQTCVANRDDLRLIVILKEIERVYYE